MNRNSWTKQELKAIEKYPIIGIKATMKLIPNRTERAIIAKANRMLLSKWKRSQYSDEQIYKARELAMEGELTTKQIGYECGIDIAYLREVLNPKLRTRRKATPPAFFEYAACVRSGEISKKPKVLDKRTRALDAMLKEHYQTATWPELVELSGGLSKKQIKGRANYIGLFRTKHNGI